MLGPHVDRASIPRLGVCIYTIGRVDSTIYLQQLFLEHLSLDTTPLLGLPRVADYNDGRARFFCHTIKTHSLHLTFTQQENSASAIAIA
jgi:hypothetical protein